MLTKLKSLVVAAFLLLSTGVFCYSQNVTMKMTGVTVGDAITALNQNAKLFGHRQFGRRQSPEEG